MNAETKRATRIGIFVVSSVLILGLTAAVVTSGKLFNESYQFVVQFNTSLKGLIVGAPVSLYGVQVGRVDSIQIINDAETKTYSLPITIELDKETFFADEGSLFSQEDANIVMQEHIESGLRAELKSMSLVSGSLYIELNFLDSQKALNATEAEKTLPYYRDLMQIPTNSSSLDDVLNTISEIPFDEVVAHIDQVLLQTNEILMDIESLLESGEISNLIVGYTDLAHSINNEVKEFSSVRNSVNNLVNQLNSTVEKNDEDVAQLLANVHALSVSADGVVNELGSMLSEDSNTMIELLRTMQLLQSASRSVSELADVLTQNPESLIYGKQ